MDKFMNFISSHEARGVRSFSPIICLLLCIVIPTINMLKIEWLMLITVPIVFVIIIGFIIYTIKHYKNYINQTNS